MPLIYTCSAPLMGVWKMNESWQDMLVALQGGECNDACLHNRQATILSLPSDKRKQERLAARLLLRHLLNIESDGHAEALLEYDANGAPRITNYPYHISISHTIGFAAVILSKRPYPGIDIEYHSNRAWRLRERFMNANELRLFAQSSNARETWATLCWCAKETAFKALRQKEVDFASHLHIETVVPSVSTIMPSEGLLTLKETKTSARQSFVIHYRMAKDYLMTWKD